jgi:hypothetical protein
VEVAMIVAYKVQRNHRSVSFSLHECRKDLYRITLAKSLCVGSFHGSANNELADALCHCSHSDHTVHPEDGKKDGGGKEHSGINTKNDRMWKCTSILSR